MTYSGKLENLSSNMVLSKHSLSFTTVTNNVLNLHDQINGVHCFHDGKKSHSFNNEIRIPVSLLGGARSKCVITLSNTKNITSKISSVCVWDMWAYSSNSTANLPSECHNVMNGLPTEMSYSSSGTSPSFVQNSFYTKIYLLKD
jgi:hypothetical protein